MSLVLLLAGAAGAAEGDPIKIYKLGNPASTISTERAETKEDLQRLVDKYRNALNVALAQSDYTVYPDDLYEAAKNAEPISVAVGETYHWMVFRNKAGQPTISSRPVEWAAKDGKPFKAWRLHFASGDKLFTFDIPVTCLNLALKKVEEIPVPSCSLTARHQPSSTCGELGTVAISGSGDRIAKVTSSAGAVTSSGDQRWSFTPSAPGSVSFEATTEPNRWGKTATCSATASVPKPDPCDPVCRLRGSYDATSGDIDLDAAGSEGTVEITGVTLPDGSAGDVGAVRSVGGNRWSYTPVVRKKAGDYTFSFDARATRAGRTVDCDTSVVVPVVKTGPDGAWILRLYGARIDGDDAVDTATPGIDGFGEQTWTALQGGTGVGIALEYLFTDRVGLEANFLFGEIDAEYMADRIDSWVMDEANVDFRTFTLGPNFHLTPGRRADVYIGPFVGIVQYGTAIFDVPTGLVRMEFDDDFGFGGQIGVDIPFGASRWGFHSALRYISTSAEQEGGLRREFDYDPLIFGAGLAFRF